MQHLVCPLLVQVFWLARLLTDGRILVMYTYCRVTLLVLVGRNSLQRRPSWLHSYQGATFSCMRRSQENCLSLFTVHRILKSAWQQLSRQHCRSCSRERTCYCCLCSANVAKALSVMLITDVVYLLMDECAPELLRLRHLHTAC